MSNVIQFPSEKIKFKSAFDAKFHEETKSLSPQLADCLKRAYEKVMQTHGGNLPGFELRISGNLSDIQTNQIQEAVERLMAEYKERIVSILKIIMELEAKICMLKFQSNLSGNRDD